LLEEEKKEGPRSGPSFFMLKIVMKNGAGPFAGVDINDFLDFTFVNVKYPSV
jgi:hypothetical protein